MQKDDNIPLRLKGVSAGYGTVPAITGIDIALQRGKITTIIGANGAGKSTLLKTICGLVRPTAGHIELFGEDVTTLSVDRLVAKGLSLVPEGRRLFGEMTLRENLEIGAYIRTDRGAVRRDLDKMLELFPELRDRLETPAQNFSGGQQQMVAVARALMSAPRILLLDEPTIGLAPAVVDRIGEMIRHIAATGIDILLVEQNAETALAISDRAYVLEGGMIVAEDEAGVIMQSPEVQRAYLGI